MAARPSQTLRSPTELFVYRLRSLSSAAAQRIPVHGQDLHQEKPKPIPLLTELATGFGLCCYYKDVAP